MSFYAIIIWLVASTQATVTLLALWAVKPTGRRILRWLAFPLALSVFVLVPAFEIIFVYLIQYLMVSLAAYFFAHRLYGNPSPQSTPPLTDYVKSRFNLSFLFLTTSVAASLIALIQATELDAKNWMSLIATSASSSIAGVLFLMGYWLHQRFRHRGMFVVGSSWGALAFASILSYSLSAWKDVIVSNLVDDTFLGWPLDTSLYTLDRPSLIWFPIGAVTSFLVLPFGFLMLTGRLNRMRWILPTCLILLPLPSWVAIKLLQPKPVMRANSTDNCYAQITNISSRIGKSPRQVTANRVTDWGAESNQFKMEYLSEMKPLLQQVLETESRDCFVPLQLTFDDIENLGDLRELSRCFSAVGQIEMDRDLDAACDSFLQGCVVDNRLRKEGLVLHDLVGIGCYSSCLASLSSNRRYFSTDKAQATALKLLDSISALDPAEEFIRRDEIWSRNVHWFNSLQWILADLTRHSPLDNFGFYKDIRQAELADVRLCCIGLMLERFYRSKGCYPEELEALAELLPATAFEDPFQPNQGRFRYMLTPTGYVLYSVGVNRIDDGGVTGQSRLDGDIVLN